MPTSRTSTFSQRQQREPIFVCHSGSLGPDHISPIGALSFVVAQVYEVEFRRRFKIIPHCTSASGTARFEHLPENSLLALLPKDETVKTVYNHVEIRARAQLIFGELVAEREVLSKAVASLRTVRRKGKANIHITELLEDECVSLAPANCGFSCHPVLCAPPLPLLDDLIHISTDRLRELEESTLADPEDDAEDRAKPLAEQ